MLTKSEKSFSCVYIIILFVEIITGSLENFKIVHYIAKPSLLISLIIFFNIKSSHLAPSTKKYMFPALFMCLVGDILLMFVDFSASFFMSGLVAFLLGHTFYIMTFLQFRNKTSKPIILISILICYAFCLFNLLKNELGDMLIPVLLYMIVILSMSIASFLRRGKVNSMSFYFVFLGAILFMISDSLIALNKFYKPLPWSNIYIMFTYAIAQLMIVFGVLKQR